MIRLLSPICPVRDRAAYVTVNLWWGAARRSLEQAGLSLARAIAVPWALMRKLPVAQTTVEERVFFLPTLTVVASEKLPAHNTLL